MKVPWKASESPRGLFCTLAVVYTCYFDCVMKANAWKVKVANIFAMLNIWCKIETKKMLQITIPLGITMSLTLILMLWWIEPPILRSHRKVYQNVVFNFKDIWKRKFVFYQTLIALFRTGRSFSSPALVESSYSNGFHML